MYEEIEVTQELFNKVQNLTRELQPLSQEAFGFFTTKTRHAVSYNDPEIRIKVQDELDHSVALLAIAHVMTIFEDNFPSSYWEEIINDTDTYKKLKAYKHVRSSIVNGLTGCRTNESDEYNCFNEVMNTNNPIKGVKSFDNEKIFLAESAGNYAHVFLMELMNKVIVEVHRRLI